MPTIAHRHIEQERLVPRAAVSRRLNRQSLALGVVCLAVLGGCQRSSEAVEVPLPVDGASVRFLVAERGSDRPQLQLTVANRTGGVRTMLGQDLAPLNSGNLYLTSDDWIVLIFGSDVYMFDVNPDQRPRPIPWAERPRAAASSWRHIGLVTVSEAGRLKVYSPEDLQALSAQESVPLS